MKRYGECTTEEDRIRFISTLPDAPFQEFLIREDDRAPLAAFGQCDPDRQLRLLAGQTDAAVESILQRCLGPDWMRSNIFHDLPEQQKLRLGRVALDMSSMTAEERQMRWGMDLGDDTMVDFLNSNPHFIHEHYGLSVKDDTKRKAILNSVAADLVWNAFWEKTGIERWYMESEFEEVILDERLDELEVIVKQMTGMRPSRPDIVEMPPDHTIRNPVVLSRRKSSPDQSMDIDIPTAQTHGGEVAATTSKTTAGIAYEGPKTRSRTGTRRRVPTINLKHGESSDDGEGEGKSDDDDDDGGDSGPDTGFGASARFKKRTRQRTSQEQAAWRKIRDRRIKSLEENPGKETPRPAPLKKDEFRELVENYTPVKEKDPWYGLPEVPLIEGAGDGLGWRRAIDEYDYDADYVERWQYEAAELVDAIRVTPTYHGPFIAEYMREIRDRGEFLGAHLGNAILMEGIPTAFERPALRTQIEASVYLSLPNFVRKAAGTSWNVNAAWTFDCRRLMAYLGYQYWLLPPGSAKRAKWLEEALGILYKSKPDLNPQHPIRGLKPGSPSYKAYTSTLKAQIQNYHSRIDSAKEALSGEKNDVAARLNGALLDARDEIAGSIIYGRSEEGRAAVGPRVDDEMQRWSNARDPQDADNEVADEESLKQHRLTATKETRVRAYQELSPDQKAKYAVPSANEPSTE